MPAIKQSSNQESGKNLSSDRADILANELVRASY
jgi:hypothetical protein